MKTISWSKKIRSRIIYTIIVAVLLVMFFVSMINYIYKDAERDGFNNLHVETKEIKEAIELQMISDRENLLTMANFAAKLHSYGESYDVLLKSFEAIGLIGNIGILLPDNTFLTEIGPFYPSKDIIDFEEEKLLGEYISGIVNDITNPQKEVVRNVVPIIHENETVAILYGVIKIETISERYLSKAEEIRAQLYVIERGNGNLIINTHPDKFPNISSLSSRVFKKEFSYEQLKNDIDKGKSGFSSFESNFTDDTLYIHYSPLEISDWQIMLAAPESNVFSEARNAGSNLLLMFLSIIIIMTAYLLLMFEAEQKQSKLNSVASGIRKRLLEINQQTGSIRDALENISKFAHSRSAFFVDTDGEDYNYIAPSLSDKLLTGTDRKYFVAKLLHHSFKDKKNINIPTVNVLRLVANTELRRNDADFFDFLRDHGIKQISFAGIANKNNHISILGVINSKKNSGVRSLLAEIAVCFSMAIYNKKYLNKTEAIAVTDSLTGLSNRLAYKKEIARQDEKMSDELSCIYIDVNELHIINNKYGHSTGDGMLLFIASTLKEVFEKGHVFRIGGDEFLVFTENTPKETVEELIVELDKKIQAMDYHVSIGMSFRNKNIDTESLVIEAEKRMYEAKAEYYQKKDRSIISKSTTVAVDHIKTGIREFDALLSILSSR
ncbi:MAG: GGDEF domain-containing protein, partial [Clostridia bacterium]|nr:GGDEF domain-containing protein [Clostridia bacterium]